MTHKKLLPMVPIIQGGMGVAVSDWRLAKAVASKGQLGVVSGTALHIVLARRLVDGDFDGHMRRAIDAFPDHEMAKRVLDRWYCLQGRAEGDPYLQIPLYGTKPLRAVEELNVVANFVEVHLAKEGHGGQVGINLLTKIEPPTLSSLYGAMLADVDVVIMGAGVPSHIPGVLDRLAAGQIAELAVDVVGSSEGRQVHMTFDPSHYGVANTSRPAFLAIISSVVLANYLGRDETIRPDGFVVEKHDAGGHNAPPRSKDQQGQPAYGNKDEIDFQKITKLGLPFWIAGGQASSQALELAHEAGAVGVQIGTAFALCQESGLRPDLKSEVVRSIEAGTLNIRTDMRASASGFPFKVAEVEGTLSEKHIYERRKRVCDLGLLRTAYEREDGNVGFRCSAEPVTRFVRKRGEGDTEGRMCLCNGLLASVGLAQIHDGLIEPPLVTLGEDTSAVLELVRRHGFQFTAADVIDQVLAGVASGR